MSGPAMTRDFLQPPGTVRLAVIGDYGDGSQAAADVAGLVRTWQPNYVITTGDNNYPAGEAATIDGNVGRFYHDFIAPYAGDYGAGAGHNRFFPALGNHDWVLHADGYAWPTPYLSYFTLPAGPGQERYYDVLLGPVHLFVLDSDYHEPDGNTAGSVQAAWLRERLAASTAPWKLVVTHEPPYSSTSFHGPSPHMRWPFQEWGATAVLAGHNHIYERILRNGFPYFVNGLGSSIIYRLGTADAGSVSRHNGDSGALLIEANADSITFRFVTRGGLEIDVYAIGQGEDESISTPAQAPPKPQPTAAPRRLALNERFCLGLRRILCEE